MAKEVIWKLKKQEGHNEHSKELFTKTLQGQFNEHEVKSRYRNGNIEVCFKEKDKIHKKYY